MEPQEISKDVLMEKYAKGDEKTADDVRLRVAKALASVEANPKEWEPRFFEAMQSGFIPAGRIMSAAGTGIRATLINCFVQPVGDSMTGTDTRGYPGIMNALAEASETMRRGGGVGYQFGHIRPSGAKVHGTQSNASGPLSYMDVFDSMCKTVESAGARRGAQMGVLRCDHPDIEAFVVAKQTPGRLTQFNISIGVTDDFMRAVESDGEWDLVHEAEPGEALKKAGAFRREDGLWVYKRIRARDLWEQVMKNTYDHAEPGVLFIDTMNRENNLHYVEKLEATNPCAEQPLPNYGCCCLGSIDLTRYVKNAFSGDAEFDKERFTATVQVAVRMLDDVLDVTYWPLEKQREEAMAKRRVGLGFTGLGDALMMLGLRYDSEKGREWASSIALLMRNEAYRASINISKEKGAFPLFDIKQYLDSGFTKRLPEWIRRDIARFGIRNSHLLSIAPTGTISLAFADNASNGIEPPFSWNYNRKKREADGSSKEYTVEDHAFRLYREIGGDTNNLPDHFVTALSIRAADHLKMVAAVAPYIDTSISKTVNVPADYPYEDFKDLYFEAWKSGCKGLATYRPNLVTGAVLSVDEKHAAAQKEDTDTPAGFDDSDPDRRIVLADVPSPPLASLRWRKRPSLPGGNPCWTFLVEHPHGYKFGVFVGHIENGGKQPFEVWVNGTTQPRGLGAIAKSLSMDLRSEDKGWVKVKLDSLSKLAADDGFILPMPPDGEERMMPSLVAGFAALVRWRCENLGAFNESDDTPVLDALMSRKEPKTGPDGTMSWAVDIRNPVTGDDFVMGVKELVLATGQRRPYSLWLSGVYPRALDGLCKCLSFDMRVLDPAWVGAKLRQLLDYAEPQGDFMARMPRSEKQAVYPSSVAYMARVLIHRYAMLGILDEDGFPMESMGVMAEEATSHPRLRAVGAMEVRPGKRCNECGNYSVIRKDGCEFCTACGAIGACG